MHTGSSWGCVSHLGLLWAMVTTSEAELPSATLGWRAAAVGREQRAELGIVQRKDLRVALGLWSREQMRLEGFMVQSCPTALL